MSLMHSLVGSDGLVGHGNALLGASFIPQARHEMRSVLVYAKPFIFQWARMRMRIRFRNAGS